MKAPYTDSMSLYEPVVLDTTALLGAAPQRFAGLEDLELYFSMARGDATRPAAEMTKYFGTNYHYIVPKIGPDTTIELADRHLVERLARLKDHGLSMHPVVGPVTWLALSKPTVEGYGVFERFDDAVTSVEAARSKMELLRTPRGARLHARPGARYVGHSLPSRPPTDEIDDLLGPPFTCLTQTSCESTRTAASRPESMTKPWLPCATQSRQPRGCEPSTPDAKPCFDPLSVP